MKTTKSVRIGSAELSFETGHVAKQASGSVMARYGDTVVLVTAQASGKDDPGRGFLPLTVEYREKFYAAGKIPGGFFKREARPSEKEILTCRMIDRPIRPLFSKGWSQETQVIAYVLSADQENDSDIVALTGASMALCLSDIPFDGPLGAVRIGRVDGEFIVNPTFEQREEADLILAVAGKKDSIVMVEGGAQEVEESVVVEALQLAFDEIQKLIGLQEEMLATGVGHDKVEFTAPAPSEELTAAVHEAVGGKIHEANLNQEKKTRSEAVSAVRAEVMEALAEQFPEDGSHIRTVVSAMEKEDLRLAVLDEERRADGRGLKDIRPISCEVGVLPRPHGSALFTRGETQALVVTTLGTTTDEQKIDALEGATYKSYMLHYNFPPFCVGEVRRMFSTSRREVGHGALAERALEPVIPSDEIFPYTVRLVSEVTESNGSSSMASVCGGSLALMDAAVPIKTPVAGIAMGLIGEGDRYAVLSDILGVEDHLGDMDFKVTGSRDGITALQMDNKLGGIPFSVLEQALMQARDGRIHILDKMSEALEAPREELSEFAPRILQLSINPKKIRDIIGPGGKMIRSICEETGANIDVDDDGSVKISSVDRAAGQAALQRVKDIVTDPELNATYTGKVRRIEPFGAFVEILPGRDGLVHISELDRERVNEVTDIVKEGDVLTVKVIGIDDSGKVRLSRKAVIMEEAGEEYVPSTRGPRRDSRGPRRRGPVGARR
ncbi:MAG: polyribonucleotide nucleotidyltransferase [Gemmatimonadota bacterium]|jgi:polyribonucleotide nucleotidyltransferase|nr:polyribonucleotide nucleotidyltransferase [Gemmatimonadota bacterium]MDP7031549.1 polyribonucleotide nucleotidyltransferase [Gemmatimonadota bacterium]